MSAYAAALTEDALVTVADLRARGSSWGATADAVGWAVADLRRAVRREPEFDRYYDDALREVQQETEAEMLLTYRKQMRDDDTATARRAADALAKYGAGLTRDQTRLEVENIRAGVARARLAAKLAAKQAKDDPEAEPPIDVTAMTPEQVHTPDLESYYARRATDTKAVVWLWGGGHRIGDTAPDAATDTPLVLFEDTTVRGRDLFWAVRFPLPGHPQAGPFPVPGAFQPAPDLTPEQAGQVADFAATSAAAAPPAA